MRTWAGWLVLGLAAVLGAGSPAFAYFLDAGRNFDVRLRAYSQLGILTEGSSQTGCVDGEPDGGSLCPPQYDAGTLAQLRMFYNPEFDAKLTPYTSWMNGAGLGAIAPDDMKFRFAWWGFYDGVYDVLDNYSPWNDNRRKLRGRYSQSDNPVPKNPNEIAEHPGQSLLFNDENKNPRHIYGRRNRINELYLDYTKGRFFFRVGRQAVSWGEADTIALLDASNLFDLTQGAPGFFEDLEESRIPFWAFRSTIKLVDNWRWLSSVFADAYLVPGPIDTTVPINPIIGGVTPFGPDQADAQKNFGGQTVPLVVNGQNVNVRLHSATVDRLPTQDWSNTRWGARLTGVLFRDYTVQGWFYRTFNQAPAPQLLSTARGATVELAQKGLIAPTLINKRGAHCAPGEAGCFYGLPIVQVLERRLESVFGVAATWFSPMVNGIIRTEAEYFLDEVAFIPNKNLDARSQVPKAVLDAADPNLQGQRVRTSLPRANFLRFVLGYDRFFFFRPLNPSNSFIVSMAFNGSINMSERRGTNFRNPNPKPGKSPFTIAPIKGSLICTQQNIDAAATNPLLAQLVQSCVKIVPENFEDLYKFEGFLNTAFQTDYLHGRLTPRIVFITDVSGTFGFQATSTYRFTDNFLAGIAYLAIASSRKSGLATFRSHDMLQLRLTYQLN